MDRPLDAWRRYQRKLLTAAGVTLDLSRVRFPRGFLHDRRTAIDDALDAMAALEKGAIANPDEGRMVGHYWLRAPELAPSREIRHAIEAALAQVKDFAGRVHRGEIRPHQASHFHKFLLVGIGGSALGPQLVADALHTPDGRLDPFFLDNTDPSGIDRVLAALEFDDWDFRLDETLVIVTSKSGSTAETRNGLIETRAVYEKYDLRFAEHAVAVTQAGSQLSKQARKERWLAQFPMWDWVGGRTSETSVVGLLPAALQGIDIDLFLGGARDMDRATRRRDARRNPAMLLALAWLHATDGRGAKDMVVLPYKDRLTLFAKYLQQLVMESLGKERDRHGNIVRQGIAVYGNKGSTDQHSYVQQLREGVHNFFVTFIEVLRDRKGKSIEVEPGLTSGDYLLGFLLGTRDALSENGRESITLTIQDVTPRSLGALIALYERAVGFYASLVGINAYHQPGVEAGKQGAARAIELQLAAVKALRAARGKLLGAEEVARRAKAPEAVETVYKVLLHLAANRRGVRRKAGAGPAEDRFAAL